MKIILTLTLVLCAMPCFAEEKILYDYNGVIFGYNYEKIGTATDIDCPDIKFDEYQIIVKVKNTNSKAIDLIEPSGRLHFKSDYCTKAGNLQSNSAAYQIGLFSPHRHYATGTPNTNFGVVNSYFLDAKDEYSTLPNKLKVRSGDRFPEPDWIFPKWKFIDLPNKQNVVNTGKIIPKATNLSTDYAKLIVGKWRFSQSSDLKNGKEVDIYDEEEPCFDIYETNKRIVQNIGDCEISKEDGNWTIVDNILTKVIDGDVTKYEILRLDKSTLKLKFMKEYDDGSYFLATFERVTK
ncbi:lipocalin family protein [Acinetobacter sp. NIPH 298]|uniref:lipocalin family protein n=1 Tax=Acinetobacter sp. NIPH 298 TaxID=1217692 RepID=UPI0002D116CE|nr:lipocalin family protein [Acinetobacter sp. NIPH 298]ENW95990.1 hypothetical protein F903_01758 [Acinetobacter sp. NIPH 298]